MMKTVGSPFELRKVGGLELVCKDIARTSAFYGDALGMPVVNRVQLPGEAAQRIVFDAGDGARLVFLWFPPAAEPGRSVSRRQPAGSPMITAHGSIEHVTFEVSVERFDAYAARLKKNGVPVAIGFEREERPMDAGEAPGQPVRRRSLHCLDPDGVSLEFACWPGPSVPAARTTPDAMARKRVARRPAEPALALA
jgi:catechol 2,3-dioxygenase-like lactoylglutathione lyase family enzyme